MPAITLPDQIRCVQRELALRTAVYPKWIAQGKMTEAKATTEIAAMQAVLDTLHGLAPAQPSLFEETH